MRRLEALRNEATVLRTLLRGMRGDLPHAERLRAFYAPQAAHYDRFRERLLPGRAELVARLPQREGLRVVELGGGTGRNLEFFGSALDRFASVHLVDLCGPLLARAHERLSGRANVHLIEADATTWRPPQAVDCVYLSFALTMIPDWQAALRNAVAMLRPGGVLGVVDFHVGPDRPRAGRKRHGWFTRRFWPAWFAHDGVRLDPRHLSTLQALLPDHSLREARAPVPYLPGLRVPYYVFVGRRDLAPA